MRYARPLLLTAATLLAACSTQSPNRHTSATPAPAAAHPSKPVDALLAGRWHNNNHELAGATKQFTPDKGNQRHGRADGFFPEGGFYTITSVQETQRSLEIAVKKDASGGEPAQSFTARLVFKADGNHFTLARVTGQGGPSAGIEFYRTN